MNYKTIKKTVFLFFILISNQSTQAIPDSLNIIDLGIDTSFCSGDSIVLSPNFFGDSLIWNTGATTEQITISEEGVYSVIVFIDSIACSDTIVVTKKPSPVINFSADTQCFGNPTTFSNLSVFLPDANQILTFGDGAFVDSVGSIIAHEYTTNGGSFFATLLIDNQNGCSDTDSIEVIINATPIVQIAADTVCFGNSTTFSNLSVFLPDANQTLTFGDGAFTDSVGSIIAHEYTVNGGIFEAILLIDNLNGCSDTGSVEAIINASPISQISADTICFGNSTTFTNSSVFLPDANQTLTFGDGTFTDSVGNMIAYEYAINGDVFEATLFIDNQNGCSDIDSIDVIIYTSPIAQITVDSVCFGEAATIENQSQGVDALTDYAINYGDSFFNTLMNLSSYEYTYSDSGSYEITIVITNLNGCEDSINIFSETHPLPKAEFTGLAMEYCANSPVDTLWGQPLGGMFSGDYISQNGNLVLFTPTEAANNILVTYRYENVFECVDIDSQYVEIVYPIPEVSFMGLEEYCIGDSIDTLAGNFAGGIFTGINIEDDSTLNDSIAFFNPIQEGVFPIEYSFTDENNCSNSTIVEYSVFPLPIVDLGNDTFLMSGNTIILSNSINNPEYEYVWSTGETTSTITVSNPSFYILTITNGSTGCIQADTILVDFENSTKYLSLLSDLQIYPNPFSEKINLSFKTLNQGEMKLNLLNLNGEVLLRRQIFLTNADEAYQLNLDQFSKGIYFLRMEDKVIKIIKH